MRPDLIHLQWMERGQVHFYVFHWTGLCRVAVFPQCSARSRLLQPRWDEHPAWVSGFYHQRSCSSVGTTTVTLRSSWTFTAEASVHCSVIFLLPFLLGQWGSRHGQRRAEAHSCQGQPWGGGERRQCLVGIQSEILGWKKIKNPRYAQVVCHSWE